VESQKNIKNYCTSFLRSSRLRAPLKNCLPGTKPRGTSAGGDRDHHGAAPHLLGAGWGVIVRALAIASRITGNILTGPVQFIIHPMSGACDPTPVCYTSSLAATHSDLIVADFSPRFNPFASRQIASIATAASFS